MVTLLRLRNYTHESEFSRQDPNKEEVFKEYNAGNDFNGRTINS